MIFPTFISGYLLASFSIPTCVFGHYSEYKLISYLMDSYDKYIQPSFGPNEVVNVAYGLSLTQIIDVDERNQVLTTNVWINQAWVDAHLRWNPKEFDNIKVIRLPEASIWQPDIILYNNLDPNYKTSILSTYAIVQYTGNVSLLSTAIFKSSCRISVKYFPFDEQECFLKFASWAYDGFQINLTLPSSDPDMSNFVPNGEFELTRVKVKRNVVYYSCCPEPFPDITLTIKIRRRPLFYIFNFLLPCLLITSVALLGFYMPCDSGEKVTIGITTLLSMTVFMMLVAETMPPTSEELPLLGLYYGSTIFVVSMSTAMTVFTLNLHHKGFRGRKIPKIVKYLLFNVMARILFIRIRSKYNESFEDKFDELATFSNELSETSSFLATTAMNTFDKNQLLNPQASMNFLSSRNYRSNLNPPRSFEDEFLRILEKINLSILKNEYRYRLQDIKDKAKEEWMDLAIVVDRLMLIIFLIATITLTVIIFNSSPNK